MAGKERARRPSQELTSEPPKLNRPPVVIFCQELRIHFPGWPYAMWMQQLHDEDHLTEKLVAEYPKVGQNEPYVQYYRGHRYVFLLRP